MKFVPSEGKIYVKTYSPYLDQYETDSNSEFTLDYPYNYLGQDTNVASNTNATFLWEDLETSTTYEWYVEVVDADGVKNISQTWNFTTMA